MLDMVDVAQVEDAMNVVCLSRPRLFGPRGGGKMQPAALASSLHAMNPLGERFSLEVTLENKKPFKDTDLGRIDWILSRA